MRGRPRDPTRARRRTGHRPKPDEAPALAPVPEFPGPARLDPPACGVCEGHGSVREQRRKRRCDACEGRGTSLPAEMIPTWRAVVAALGPISALREGDALAIELLVRQYHRVRQMGALLDAYGVWTRSGTGTISVSPFLRAEREASAAFLRLAEHYGLTVASRMRLGLLQLQGQSLAETLAAELAED